MEYQRQQRSGGLASDYYGGGQQPPEYQQQQQRHQHHYAPPMSDDKQTFEQTFKIVKPKWNDLWAGILLVVTFLGFVAVSGLSVHGYATTKDFNGGGIYGSDNDFGLSTNTIILFAFVLVVAFVTSYAYLWGARVFTKQFIWITGILQIVLGLGTAVYYFIKHYYSAAIVFAIFTVFYIVCFISWIPRIPFSVLMLQTTIDVAKKYGHVFLVSLIGGLISVAFAAWYSVTLVAIYVKYQPANNPACSSGGGSCSSAKVIGLIVFVTFAGFWISEWLKNTVHTTIAGVYGSWYFCSQKPGGFPKGATRGALKRAMTYSFGSISFGSLVVSLIQMLRHGVSVAQQSESAQGNIVGAALLCVAGCLISILEWAVKFINHYAFSHIALYGKAYLAAAKDTWRMMKDRGIDALVNDCLIDPVLTMGSIAVGYLCALLAFLYLQFTSPTYNSDGSFTPVIMAFSFLIGLQICNVFMVPLKSGTATFFVAAAWDPQVLITEFPDLYQRMVAVYPHVQHAIHA
ncbi:MAG: putative choline transporter, neither null mutation nor overexpression affects choline transport [Geoglossum simile]|nr:MAG: putative choline transporter, neither null mutation nor overexpression affects choline transport [Geoglossum simile]